LRRGGEVTCVAICGAKTRAGTPCKYTAGWGTDHLGRGRCKFHGGASKGAPKGNKNALKTGERETIWLDQLADEEKALYTYVTTDKLKALDEEIRLITIRERRMLQRIGNLRKHDMTVIETVSAQGTEKGQETDLLTEKRQATLGQIQAIEDALTRVQAQKARLIEAKHKIEMDSKATGDQGKGQIADLIDAMRKAAEDEYDAADTEG